MFLTPNDNIFSYIMTRTSYVRLDDNDVHFVLEQNAYLDIYTATPLNKQSTDRHVAPFGHIIMAGFGANQSLMTRA